MAISMLKIRRPLERLIFNMGSPYLVRPSFLLRRPPGRFITSPVTRLFFCCCCCCCCCYCCFKYLLIRLTIDISGNLSGKSIDDRWFPRTKEQQCEITFHIIMPSWHITKTTIYNISMILAQRRYNSTIPDTNNSHLNMISKNFG